MPRPLAAIAVAIAFLLSVLTYRYVEIPIRFGARKRRSAFRLLIGLALAGGLGVLMKTGLTGTEDERRPVWDRISGAPVGRTDQTHFCNMAPGVLLFSQPGDSSRAVFFSATHTPNHYWARVLGLSALSRGDFPTVSIT